MRTTTGKSLENLLLKKILLHFNGGEIPFLKVNHTQTARDKQIVIKEEVKHVVYNFRGLCSHFSPTFAIPPHTTHVIKHEN